MGKHLKLALAFCVCPPVPNCLKQIKKDSVAHECKLRVLPYLYAMTADKFLNRLMCSIYYINSRIIFYVSPEFPIRVGDCSIIAYRSCVFPSV